MEHASLNEIKNRATVHPFEPAPLETARALRRRRLERFAILLEQHDRPIQLFTGIEYLPRYETEALRSDESPLTVAYRDPVLREQGLAGDWIGDAMAFFNLTADETHKLLCDCHYIGAITPGMIAARVRSVARRMTFGEIWTKVRSSLMFR